MAIGRFTGGIAALIRSPDTQKYLLLRRSEQKDFAQGIWECVTGRVEQGEGFEEAVRREVREELSVEVQIEHILGTTHFHRGATIPENEMVGVVYLCSLIEPAALHISAEHSEYRWLTAAQALRLLADNNPSTQWARRVIERAEIVRPLLSKELLSIQRQIGFELG